MIGSLMLTELADGTVAGMRTVCIVSAVIGLVLPLLLAKVAAEVKASGERAAAAAG
jgi:hypothetical protein